MIFMKKWYKSKTIWGAILSMSSGALAFFGIVLTNAQEKELAELIVQTITALAPVIGGWASIYGRLKAEERIG
jgi:hypothetical protein